MLIRVWDRKSGEQGLLQAWDMNAARREYKKQKGCSNIPKSVWFMPVSPKEIQQMMEAQKAEVERLENKAEEIQTEAEAIIEEIKKEAVI